MSGRPKSASTAGLGALLAEAGIDVPLSEIEDRLAAVAAAPVSMISGPALDIIAPSLKGAGKSHLADALAAEVEKIAGRYDQAAAPGDHARRLGRLRGELRRTGLDGFIVPRTDEHQGEYISRRAQRLEWLTGFGGSAGVAVILADKAAIFVDGRYTLQVKEQVDLSLMEPLHLTDQPPEDWLAATAATAARIGYDPWLHTEGGITRYRKAAARVGAELVRVEENPIDAIWTDQPPPPLSPVEAHDIAFTGEDAASKRQRIAEAIREHGADAAVLTAPDSIAWLLNVRGGDIQYTPLSLSFAIVAADGAVDWFIDRRKIDDELLHHIGNRVAIRDPLSLGPALAALGGEGKSVLVDPGTAPVWIFDRLTESLAQVVREPDPCQLSKSCKNAIELDGARAAHVRDGAALTRFLAWLAVNVDSGEIDEISAARKLAGFRRGGAKFRDLSFATISGAGSNGAIVHYKVAPETNRRLENGLLYLVDSGAQYLDGTTDVTRTVAIGEPGDEQKDRFTRVLKGHIALATCRFPEGTTGSQLDTLARLPLWAAGLDYDHGTGHGVGSYLGVHEGPQRIAKIPNKIALKPGMIVSNEPGFYKTGDFGIRIENLICVVECEAKPGGPAHHLSFETLTLAPIDLSLVDVALMTDAEMEWLNRYHLRVFEKIAPLLDDETTRWLRTATRPITRD